MDDEPREITVNTPEGEVIATEGNEEAKPQTVTVVVGEELAWLQTLGRDGPDFVAAYVPDVATPELQDYDTAFASWQQDPQPTYSSEQVIECLGGYLGNRMIADFDMEWVVVKDEYGTDYAVRSKTSETLAFVFSSVLKRIEDGDAEFVHGLFHVVKNTISKSKQADR